MAVVAAAPGCSWIFVHGPPPEGATREATGECTTNRAAPVVDTIFTSTNLASAIYVVGQNDITDKTPRVVGALTVATLWAISAAYGYRMTSACERWRGERLDVLVRQESRARSRPRPAPATPAPVPAQASADGVSGQSPPAPSAPAAEPAGPAIPQQPDEDEPGRRRPRRPPSIETPQQPDAPRFGG